MTVERIPIWLDCDPGHDDVVAILVAVFHPKLELLGISTVYGNTSLENTTANALAILTAIGRTDIPVHVGAAQPLVKTVSHAQEIHGESGLDGSSLVPLPATTASLIPAIEAMKTAVETHPGMSIVATGTLTNMAQLYAAYPHLKPLIRYVSIMGGGINIGNKSKYAEFNIVCDPEAALQVLTDAEMAPKTILIPLNLTHQAICTKKVRVGLYDPSNPSKSSPLRQMFSELMMFFAITCETQGFMDGPPVHDPVAVYVLLAMYGEAGLGFEYTSYDLTVPLEGEREGETAVVKEDPQGVKVGLGLNIEKFWNAFLQCMELADVNAPLNRK
ncbi:hypothetical protein BABINDRAFT_33839 [Babjeviella inositovora NRRL Y-12698]|uniref:Inosine/uridine-preferring nucleoside hydrolase domain-containing protein n=1 Tax=Babjeviella inositovora NRRL Y-12698 TaxID=984486 RepID=A0A1E3QVZ2_9ASCO|nr:uncharacterized protein BABINDRAFT_33839 [Babjeviella inositovora NRRL Y-12698]ODQ81147.1 hypothetical protein BABINDRAFT_33839 [Babjeviella inositovora NRRL Y-12698]